MDNDDFRILVVEKISDAIWLHGLKTTGTASSKTSVHRELAESIADIFTCTECGFLDVGVGNYHGECNDCAPRVTARRKAEQA